SEAKKNVYIVLLGTNHIFDIWDNLQFDLVDYPNHTGKIHSGFYQAWGQIRDAVYTCIDPIKDDVEVIYVTGHSYGAAIGEIALPELKARYASEIVYYGFAIPRIGNQDFSNYMRTSFTDRYEILYAKDLVPCVPSRAMGYYHCEPFYVVGSKGQFILTDDNIHSGDDFETLLNVIQGPFRKEHQMKTYLQLMEGILTSLDPHDPDAQKILDGTCKLSLCDRCPILRKLRFW
ncbi:MAG: lipase family protein, partial [Methanobacteriota archaeon]